MPDLPFETIEESTPVSQPMPGSARLQRTLAGVRVSLGAHVLTALMLAGILLLAGVLRLTNVNWDKGQHLHPDERFLSIIQSEIKGPKTVGQYFDSRTSPLNPYQYSNTFVYGTVPMFLNKAVSSWLAAGPDGKTYKSGDAVRSVLEKLGVSMTQADGKTPNFNDGYDGNRVGRVLSALADLLTIVLLFELGRVLYDKRVGLLAAALLGFTVLHIQYSHFFGSETYLALFVTAVIYFSVRIIKYGSWWNYAWCGLAYGLAMATKLNSIPVLLIPGIAVLIRVWPQLESLYEWLLGFPPPWRRESRPAPFDAGQLARPLLGGIAILLIAGVVFRIFQPYAFDSRSFFDVFRFNVDVRKDFLSPSGWLHLEPVNPAHYFKLSPKFTADISSLRTLQQGQDFPPNVQWINRAKVIFPAENIIIWGLGVPLAIAVIGACFYEAYQVFWRRQIQGLLLLAWVVFYFFFIARGFNPTMRYFIPIYPPMVLLAAFGLVRLWEYALSGQAKELLAGRLQRLRPAIGPALVALVCLAVVGTFLWALAFMGVYRQDISRVQATNWISKNVPAGATLTNEEWDDGLPLNLPHSRSDQFKHVTLKPYVQDSPQKVEDLVAGLDQADYVIESSGRLYLSIPREPARYPSTVRYYDALFDGSLGFQKVAELTNYPELFGIQIPDKSAEEAFSVYDHPVVIIWKKTPAYSHDRAMAIIDPNVAASAVSLPPADARTNALLLRPNDLKTQQAGGTWTSIFSASGFAHSYPALLWFIVLEAAALAVLPATLLLFRRLPDGGYLLAKPLGLMLLAYPVWLIVSLKFAHFERATILVWLVLMLLIAAAIAARFRSEFAAFFRREWALVVVGEILFLVAFLIFYEFRLLNPDLWHPVKGGEKPMDLAYLTAVARSTTLPPYDPWFAGGYINYYYLGQFFTATLSKLTTIPPEVAFNLAIPTYVSFAAAGAFSVAYNLAAAGRSLLRRGPGFRPIPRWTVFAAGLLGVLFVVFLGNLDSVGEMVDRLSAVSHVHWHTAIPVLGPLVASVGGIWQVVFHGAHLQQFDYWRPSRIMPPTISITEFPYFTFLFADLHAHMMAIPFDILAIGATLGLVLGTRSHNDWREWLLVALLGLIVGSLRWLNSWDYPPFLLLALAGIIIAERYAEGGVVQAGVRVVAKSLLLVGLSFLFYYPFLHDYQSPVSGLHASPETTPLHQYLIHFGVFLVAVAAWLLFQLLRAFRRSSLPWILDDLWRRGPGPARDRYLRLALGDQLWLAGLVTAFFVACALLIRLTMHGLTLMAAMVPLLLVVFYLAIRELRLRRADGGLRLFVLALLGLAFGLSLGVDLTTINGDIQRMNTVFKFYMHVWILLALVASFAIWYLVFAAWSARVARSAVRAAPRYAAALALVLLVLGALIYPIEATPVRLDERFTSLPRTLQGDAYMQVAIYNDPKGTMDLNADYQGIQWMRENVQGSPTIIEGWIPDLYRWGSRFSIYTGLPTVLGWDWHQKQQRGKFSPMIDQRSKQVTQFYSDPDPEQAIRLLDEYGVKYVIVGQLEKLYYPAAGLQKFDSGLDGVLEVAYQNPSLTIYRVKLDPMALALRALP